MFVRSSFLMNWNGVSIKNNSVVNINLQSIYESV